MTKLCAHTTLGLIPQYCFFGIQIEDYWFRVRTQI